MAYIHSFCGTECGYSFPAIEKSRGKCSAVKASFSLFANVSWKALVLTFRESLVESARFKKLPFCASMV